MLIANHDVSRRTAATPAHYLQQQHHLSSDQTQRILYSESGLLGVSGINSDMRALLGSTEPAARDAVDLFVFRIARETGALISTLGGLDGFVFTAGIGENAAPVRAMVAQRLAWLGAKLDHAANAKSAGLISTNDSGIELRVIRTNEDAMIARHMQGVLNT